MLRRHFLVLAVTLSALTAGCGGIEADPQEVRGSVDTQQEALTSCESIAGRKCGEGATGICIWSDGVIGECECPGYWYCSRVTDSAPAQER